MGTIKVRAKRPGVKKGEVCGYFDDRRIYQFEEFEIPDAPLLYPSGEPIPGSIAAFSDNKRKALHGGWMEFVDPADEAKYRAGQPKAPGVPTKAAAPAAPPAPPAPPAETKGKGEKKSSGDKDVI